MQRPLQGKSLPFVRNLLSTFIWSFLVNKRPAEDPRLDAAKIARVEDDDMQKLKDRREKKFDEKNKEIAADQIRPLSGELSTEAILKLRAKFRATARDKIVDFKENEVWHENVPAIITRSLLGAAPSVTVFNVKPWYEACVSILNSESSLGTNFSWL